MSNRTFSHASVLGAALALGACLFSTSAAAQFDWGSDCESGEGSFLQDIPHEATVDVGVIPAQKGNVSIALDSDVDVDIQLIDEQTGTEIIAWPSGRLNGPSEACTTFQGVRYCYSGYNGNQTLGGLGKEWIRVEGVTNRPLIMKAYGYAPGAAPVTYSFTAPDTCNETGSGEFAQQIQEEAVVTVGDIPAGKVAVEIELNARMGRDVDIQLYDGDTALVMWPSGMLSGPTQQALQYQGMTIVYSGYNGVGGNWGREFIRIEGEVSTTLTMKAFGYQSGFADVTYSWGNGAGDSCDSNSDCDDGFSCKSGSCHTANWCQSNATIDDHCSASATQCVEFECTGGTPPTPVCGDGVCAASEEATCAADCQSSTTWPAAWDAAEMEMIDLVNDLRAQGTDCGGTWYPPVPPVSFHPQLRDAARAHSVDMGEQNYFDHQSLDGRSPFDRIRDAGYDFMAASENIAAGRQSAAGAFDQWLNSPGHCVNMMSASVDELGVGYAAVNGSTYNHYWTQNFGRR